MEIDIFISKLSENMQDSFWYQYEGDIACIKDSNKEIIICTSGEVRVKFPNEDFYTKNQQAIHNALLMELSDNDLPSLDFDQNNCFCFFYRKLEEEWEEIEYYECSMYDEALEYAKSIINDDEVWE